jgi:hypothetical protein
MKKFCLVMAFLACSFWMVGGVSAATYTENLTVNATVTGTGKLTISPTTINFGNADPDTVPSIPADSTVSVNAKARTASGSAVTLTHKANDDLKDGTKTIAITNVSWTAVGSGYVAGTMDKGADQAVGSWSGPGNYGGTLTYSMANSWSYEPGSYSATTVFTLTVP